MGVTALTFQFWEKIDPSIQIMELTSSDRAVHRGCVCKANIEKRLWRKLLYHIVKTWLSIILVYFERIVASKSERASKKIDAQGMALSGRSREGLLSRRLRRSAKGY